MLELLEAASIALSEMTLLKAGAIALWGATFFAIWLTLLLFVSSIPRCVTQILRTRRYKRDVE